MPGFSEGELSVMVWSRLTGIFRKLFSSRSTSSVNDPGLSVEIEPAEEFTRFIFSKNHFACRIHVENPASGRLIKARGVGPFQLVTSNGLSLDVNGEPFPVHVDIVGWSEAKDARLMKATEIANELKLELAPAE
jgi:hypothetical protein